MIIQVSGLVLLIALFLTTASLWLLVNHLSCSPRIESSWDAKPQVIEQIQGGWAALLGEGWMERSSCFGNPCCLGKPIYTYSSGLIVCFRIIFVFFNCPFCLVDADSWSGFGLGGFSWLLWSHHCFQVGLQWISINIPSINIISSGAFWASSSACSCSSLQVNLPLQPCFISRCSIV